MSAKIFFSVSPIEKRAALIQDEKLVRFGLEYSLKPTLRGSVFLAKVEAVQVGIAAYFVEFGGSRPGFLSFSDVNHKMIEFVSGKKKSSQLKAGDKIIVQVDKDERGNKGASLTTHISLAGRFLVLLPFSDRTGVSRRLPPEERKRLREVASKLKLPKGFGLVVRTSGGQHSQKDLEDDLKGLLKEWERIAQGFKKSRKPKVLHTEPDLLVRFLRDFLDDQVGEVWVDDLKTRNQLADFAKYRLLKPANLIKFYDGVLPLFEEHGVQPEIEKLYSPRVRFGKGGTIVFGYSEAGVMIDVNSGRRMDNNPADTAFNTNIEAADEIARQVILRDVSGIIVVDFIDMNALGRRRAVEERLRKGFAQDKAEMNFGRIREFGLMAFSRERIGPPLQQYSTTKCSVCGGSGRLRDPGLAASDCLRTVLAFISKQKKVDAVVVRCDVAVANFMSNYLRERVSKLQNRLKIKIFILADPSVSRQDCLVEAVDPSALPMTIPEREEGNNNTGLMGMIKKLLGM